MTSRLLVALLCLIVSSCNSDPDKRWQEVAGKNRPEIEKVFKYYTARNEPLKLKAAEFLVSNLRDQFHFEGDKLLLIDQKIQQYDSIYQKGDVILNRTWDSIQAATPIPQNEDLLQVFDLTNIKADMLIRHIESCFNTWNYPWARQLSFDEFCEFILPIKYANELPECWIEHVKNDYLSLIDTTRRDYDIKQLCLLVNEKFKNNFSVNGRVYNGGRFNYSNYRKLRCGTCIQTTQVVSYIMGGLGIPVAMDYTPNWANKNGRHEWSALIYQGKTLHFMGAESDPGKDKLYFTRSSLMRRKMAKVFRRTFKIQQDPFGENTSPVNNIPEDFLDRHAIDVTGEYVPVSNVEISFGSIPPKTRYAYLSIYNGNEWKPISIAAVSLFGKGSFDKMGRDVLYLPSWYIDQRVIPAANPFILSRSGDRIELKGSTEKIDKMVIKRKYPEDNSNKICKGDSYKLLYWNNGWVAVGETQAPADSVVFNNVPANTIYLVKDTDRGFQERIFTYENNKQVWW